MSTSSMNRRNLIQSAAGIGLVGLGSTPVFGRTIARLPPDVGKKVSPDGRVLPFAGNTVICHLEQQGANSSAFNALLDIYRELPIKTYRRAFVPLPPSSYHMTVFNGATDDGRKPSQWPTGILSDATIEECNSLVGERLRSAGIGSVSPIRMKIDAGQTGYDGNTLRIPLVPVDDADSQKLRVLRDRLSNVVGIRSVKHDSYQFHITLGYLSQTFTARELRDAEQDMMRWKQNMATRVPVIELGQPEYCTFEDMFAFHRQFYI